MDIYQICLNEVALEGLDGITISTLWLRLNNREEKIAVKLSPTLKEILWKFLLQHSSIEFFQIDSDRSDPVIFNRFLGIDIATGKHVAIAPDELDLMQDIYYVKPVSNHPTIRGSCLEFDTRVNVTEQLKEEHMSLGSAIQRFGEHQLVIVASQTMRDSVLRGPGVSSQTIENLTDIEYCILERIGRSRWQGEIQTVLNNYVFKQLKSAHIHYMMKSLLQKNLITKQPYSYTRDDKNGKVYQQILLHLPQYRIDARSLSDIRVETVCDMLQQSENKSISCSDLRQIIEIEGKTFRKLVSKMISAGFVKVESRGDVKNSEKIMTLLKTPSEKQDEEIVEDVIDDSMENDGEGTGLVVELPLTLQGYRHIFSTGENGCSQGDLNRKLKGYGSLEGRHLCRKVEKAKIAKIIMVDHGKQRTQKYIAEFFANESRHTKQFFAEQKKMQKILETSDHLSQNDSQDSGDLTTASTSDETIMSDSRVSTMAEAGDLGAESELSQVSSFDTSASEIQPESTITLNDSELPLEPDHDPLVKRSKWDTHQTARKMKRTNSILTFINEQKIVEGFFALQKILQSEEKDEGLTTKVCKKTVKRLVQKLHNDGRIKHFTVPITSNDCTIEVDFVMALDCDSMRLKTAIEQAQFKKYSEDTKKIASEQIDFFDLATPTLLSGSLDTTLNLTDYTKVEENKLTNKFQYGYQPKFLRNQVVHEYLWYLAYGHPLNGKENMAMLDYDKIKEYGTERNWKRFLPPIPQHPSFGPGWLQVGDAAVLLPLSVLCQFHQFPCKIEGLDQYLNDPVQKNVLVRHLPIKMRGLMFYKRKYLLSLIQVIEHLCFMGLVTFNKQKKNVNMRTRKEYEMIYIHQNVSISDTTKSEKGYSEVTEGLDYETLRFTLNTFSEVEVYWQKLRDTSLMTPLGIRNTNEEEVPETGTRHAVKMKQFIADHVTREVQTPRDDGSVPGDHKGAAGLDSSLFAHLYRNWFRPVKVAKSTPAPVDDNMKNNLGDAGTEKLRRLPKLVPTSLTLTEEHAKKPRKRTKPSDSAAKKKGSNASGSLSSKKQRSCDSTQDDVIVIDDDTTATRASPDFEIVTESNVGRNERVKGGRGKKRAADTPLLPPKKKLTKLRKPEKPSVEKKKKDKYTDLLDLQAVSKLNGKMRVSFTRGEDEVLLMCRVASSLISKTVRVKRKSEAHNVVTGLVIRDILWNLYPTSDDKTSVACLRRLRSLMRNTNALLCHDISVAEMQEDEACVRELFGDLIHRDRLDDDKEVEVLFKKVFDEVYRRFRTMRPSIDFTLPDSISEVENKCVVKIFATPENPISYRVVAEVSKERDIKLAAVENLIYVALSLNEDEFSQYQAFKIFDKFPRDLVAEVWNHLSRSVLICKKPDRSQIRQRFLPFAVPVYHLSQSYYKQLQAEPFWKIMLDSASVSKTLTLSNSLSCGMETTCGSVVLVNMLLMDNYPNYEVVSPQNSEQESIVAEQDDSTKSQDTNGPLTSSLNDVGDSDDDGTKKDEVSEKELFYLIRRKRFQERMRNSDKSKTLEPIVIRSKEDGVGICDEVRIVADVQAIVKSLDSVKLSPEEQIITVDDQDDSAGNDVTPTDPVDYILKVIKEAGVLGISITDLRKQYCTSSFTRKNQLGAILRQLIEYKIVYSVGMWHERLVLKEYACKWFIDGLAFKGDRNFLRNEIRKELSGRAKRRNRKKYEISDSGVIDLDSQPAPGSDLTDLDTKATSSTADDDISSQYDLRNAPSSSQVASEVLSNSSYYQPVKFLCRPWHNVNGEVNYSTAKLLLSGIFVHILWNPGITLAGLTHRLINILQRISIIELVEKLVSYNCVERQKGKRNRPWELFHKFEDDVISYVTSDDCDYFKVTPDGILRMSYLCHELDQLQQSRNESLAISEDEPV